MSISLVSALADESITKVAHNANFERVCLTRYVKEYAKRNTLGDAMKKKLTEDGFLPPEQWKDTMIMASENGYPSSLGQLGPTLVIEEDKEKLATG